MDHIECVVFINLDRRVDRREEIQRELDRVGFPRQKVLRVAGIDRPDRPHVGCNLSHVKALRTALALDVDSALILEDDFDFTTNVESLQTCLERLYTREADNWDVVHLATGRPELLHGWPTDSTPETVDPLLIPIREQHNASAYLIRRRVMEGLANTIDRATPLLEHTGAHWLYQNDVVWHAHQAVERWFRFPVPFGRQRLSFSDLAKCVVDHAPSIHG